MKNNITHTDQINQLSSLRYKINYYTYDMVVSELLTRLENGKMNIAPIYQRQFQWEESRQSTFIESLYLDIPIPSLFFAKNTDSTWEVVDGVQRLNSLAHFAGSKELREKLNLKDELVLKNTP